MKSTTTKRTSSPTTTTRTTIMPKTRNNNNSNNNNNNNSNEYDGLPELVLRTGSYCPNSKKRPRPVYAYRITADLIQLPFYENYSKITDHPELAELGYELHDVEGDGPCGVYAIMAGLRAQYPHPMLPEKCNHKRCRDAQISSQNIGRQS